MISISRIKKATAEFIKIIRFGNNDILTANPVNNANVDSTPIDTGVAIFAETSNNSEPIILGYINENNTADKGEITIYSQNSSGARMIELKIKNNGTIELGGNVDNIMKYGIFNSIIQTFINQINTQLVTACALIPYTWVPVTADFSTAKVNNVKV